MPGKGSRKARASGAARLPDYSKTFKNFECFITVKPGLRNFKINIFFCAFYIFKNAFFFYCDNKFSHVLILHFKILFFYIFFMSIPPSEFKHSRLIALDHATVILFSYIAESNALHKSHIQLHQFQRNIQIPHCDKYGIRNLT